jgi:protein-tyrosine phosphatase/arsenate reductase
MLFEKIQHTCDTLVAQFSSIPDERKQLLHQLATHIQQLKNTQQPIQLVYICTHNSRRSHLGQVWGQVAAAYYGVSEVSTFSGGTEATAFHPNAIKALTTDGFIITSQGVSHNPHYTVSFGDEQSTTCFSKVYDDPVNPTNHFTAIMTCSDADENCPFIPGVDLRIGTTYDDPKAFDQTPQQDEKYLERSHQIGRECLYVFSLIH